MGPRPPRVKKRGSLRASHAPENAFHHAPFLKKGEMEQGLGREDIYFLRTLVTIERLSIAFTANGKSKCVHVTKFSIYLSFTVH